MRKLGAQEVILAAENRGPFQNFIAAL